MSFTYTIIQSDDFSDCALQLDAFLSSGTESVVLLATSDNTWDLSEVNGWLKRCKTPVAGGFFPGLIAAQDKYQHNTIVVLSSKNPLRKCLVNGLSKGESFIDAQLSKYIGSTKEGKPYLVFIDGLSQNIERFTDVFYRTVGESTATIGGGAGSLDFVQKPCIFNENGIVEDAALVIELPSPLSVGIQHGWEICAGPHLVTDSSGIAINQLNYTDALQIYQNEILTHSGINLAEHNFFDIAKQYPLGIEKLDAEPLVRDPIQTDKNTLICVGEVPQNAMIYLLHGNTDKLTKAAQQAARNAVATHQSHHRTTLSTCFTVDCISRVLFMDTDFTQEISGINSVLPENVIHIGILSLGEIGNVDSGPIEWLNKTTVVGVL
ncbi:MAG: FIST C-terminal domain-containing protein [Halieaceae bacterium]|nr:FIST C-terminal domain-containing protein [Halieaceae bacterium]